MNPEDSEPLKSDLNEENPPEVSKTEDLDQEKPEDYGAMPKTEIPAFEKEKGNEKFRQGLIQEAAKHYSKALLGMKFLIKDNVIQSEEAMLQMIKEIEIPCNLNLAQCYIKMKEFKNAITHSSKVIEIEPNNIKALYRRGLSYMGLQEFDFAKDDLKKAYELEPTQPDVIAALNQLKAEKKKFNDKLKQISQKMIGSLDYGEEAPAKTESQGLKGKFQGAFNIVKELPGKFWSSLKYHCKILYLIPVGFISERCCKKRMPASFFKKGQ